MLHALRLMIVLASLLPSLACAGQVRVFVAGAAKAGFDTLLPAFKPADGDTVEVSYGTAGALRDRVLNGETPDLVILSSAAVDAIAAKGWVKDGDRRDLGAVVAGLAVRQGAPQPDIATPEALRRTLLAAQSIACGDGARGATSGAHLERVIDKLGIREQVQPKLTVLPTGTEALQGVAAGRFEIGVSQSSEIQPVAGVVFVGGLPAPFELRTAYAMAVLGGSEQAKRLMRWLDSAEGRAKFEGSGFSRN